MTPAPLQRESEALAARLVRCLAGATFEMETLVRLAGIEASRDIPTAAVTCEGRPRLLINPDFVAKRCAREEHLFLLVMHELWHVILAHTRVYPRATPEQNVAFDAVINAGLCVQFPGVEYRGFFESLNPADKFPACLLRPPPGWPSAPDYGAARGPRGLEKILRRLYPDFSRYEGPTPSYDEILALLERARADEEEKEGEDERAWPAEPVLLGDHEDPESDARAVADSRFATWCVASWRRGHRRPFRSAAATSAARRRTGCAPSGQCPRLRSACSHKCCGVRSGAAPVQRGPSADAWWYVQVASHQFPARGIGSRPRGERSACPTCFRCKSPAC